MEKVTETTEVIVGKYYLVPCAILKYDSKILTIPILGIKHLDKQFKVDFEHYHIDGRFTAGKRGDYDTDSFGLTNAIVPTGSVVYTGKGTESELIKIEHKKLLCKRSQTGIKPGNSILFITWYQTYIGKSCKGKRCPHLGTVMHSRNDSSGKEIWVCPLHDLQGCPETEVIINHESLELK